MEEIVFKTFPKQKLLFKQKDLEWKYACVDGSINTCASLSRTRRSSMEQKRRNYNIFNNKIDKSDFTYVLNPFNLSKDKMTQFQLPSNLQPYDVLSPTFNLLLGEESKRNFNPIVRGVNESVISAKLEKKKGMVIDILQKTLQAEFGQDSPLADEEIKKYLNYSPKDLRESVAEKLLTYYKKKGNLVDTFQTCWKDALVAGEEHYRIDQIGDGPKVTRVNPLELNFVLPNNSDYLDEADMIHEENYMTVPEIVDEFYEFLTPDQIDELEGSYKNGELSPYEHITPLNIPEVESIHHFSMDHNRKGVKVHRVRWKSYKKMGNWHYLDQESGEDTITLVDEYFKIDEKDKTQWLEWFWVTEYWEGIRIGVDMYLNIRPRKNQYRSIDNPSKCKSGYVGTIYSALNSQSVSLMDRLVPWLYLYLIIWYNTELLMSTNVGKVGLIDVSLIPEGWELEKWMYYIKAMKIAFVNSYNEGNKAVKFGSVNQSTQTKSLDLELGESIKNNIMLLGVIEEKIEMTSGISRQRKGAITSSELVGNTERAVVQSSHITEEYFRVHNGTKLRVCEALIEVAKDCLQGKNKNYQYITDDLAEVIFTVFGDEFCEADYGIFVTDSIKDQEALQAFKDHIKYALQSDKIQFSQVADIFNSESIADLKNKSIQVEQERNQQTQQLQAQQEKAQQEQIQLQMQMKEKELELKQYEIDQNNETKIQVAEISAYIGQKQLDLDNNGIPDPIEIGELALKQREVESKLFTEQLGLKHKKEIEDKKIDLEKQKLTIQKTIEEGKLKAVQEQNDNQIELANKKAKLDREMAEKKLQIERIKARNKSK